MLVDSNLVIYLQLNSYIVRKGVQLGKASVK